MIVDPYKRDPGPPPIVCWLTDSAQVISEHGEIFDLDTLDPDCRVWTDYDTARALVQAGEGEALCWIGEEIRWRHRRFEDGWKHRHTDVSVLRLPFPEGDVEYAVTAVAGWRDWLVEHGARPTSTTGSAAWSLLRATLDEPLFCGSGWYGEKPDRILKQTIGGRQLNGPAGPGEYVGRLEQWDLPAAYASELGGLQYGGHWHRVADLEQEGVERVSIREWAEGGRPVFVKARVRIPDLTYGPLPRRPVRRLRGLEQALFPADYPTGCILTGLWTWQEVDQAERAGCTVKVLDAWVHLAGGAKPFARWWAAIQDGRARDGQVGRLAKVTGNALWGRFCMDPRSGGQRTIRGGGLTRPIATSGGMPPAHDLAETVSGRVRAKLYAAITAPGVELVSAHTDGFWAYSASDAGGSGVGEAPAMPGAAEPPASLGEWRQKAVARRLDLIDPQTYRWYPEKPAPWEPAVVIAGTPSRLAEEEFDRRWSERDAA